MKFDILKLNSSAVFLLFMTVMLLANCCKEVDASGGNNTDLNQLPIVMVHGALASGDTYAKHAMLYGSNGYPSDMLYVYDWNSLGGSGAPALASLDKFIDGVIAKTGKSQIYLIGHSAGGGLSYSYCNDSLRSKKIAKYVHLASTPQTKPAGLKGEVPTLNVYSDGDKVVAGATIPNATNVTFDNLDHYQVATSESSFEEVYNFLLGQRPKSNVIKTQSKSKVSGRVLTLGENAATANAIVKIWQVDSVSGDRLNAVLYTLTTDEKGNFGPVELSSRMHHEFEVTSSVPAFRTVHYYRENIPRENKFLYLRSFPPASSFAGILLNSLPRNDEQAVVASFTSNQAVINGRDELSAQGITLSTPALCSPTNSTIAMFMYDNGDKVSSGAGHPTFAILPFLKGADIFIDSQKPETFSITFNGRTKGVKNFKSATEGVAIMVFD